MTIADDVAWVPRPAVLAKLDGARLGVIEASAGTGKTYTLEHLVVDLLLRGLRIDEILVVTFTEKATAELRLRVREKIAAVLGAKPGARPPGDASAWRIDGAARAALKRALAGFDGASIATIHAFCQRALAENAFAGGRLFEESSVDAREAFARAFREALREEVRPDGGAGALLRVALAGPRRIDQVEALLFACARHVGRVEMGFDEPRLREALGVLADEARGHEAAAEMARARVRANTVKAAATRLAELSAVARSFEAHGDLPAALADLEEVGKTLADTCDYLERTLGAVANGPACAALARAARDVAAYGSLDGALAAALLPAVLARFRARKDEAGLLDFDDMLRLVQAALPRLAPGLRARYRAALVDEFQDTDPVQWDVFRELFLDHAASALYLVGDPKQAIYGFRGGDVHTYLAAREEIRARGGRVVALDENFRSTGGVIAAYNHVLEGGFFTAPGVAYDAPVTCGDADLRATAVPVTLVAAGAATTSVVATWEELGPALARTVRDVLAAEPPPLLTGGGRKARPLARPRPRDVFVLASRAGEARRAAALLRAAGVPCAFYKDDGLLRGAEARAVLHLFAGLARPHDRSCRRKAWLSPFFAVPLAELGRADELPPSHPLHASLARLAALAEAREHGRLFAEIAAGTGVVRRALFAGDERALENTLHVLELTLEHAGRTAATVDELARALEGFVAGRRLPEGAEGDVQRVAGEADAVQLMTVHKSKGLEADVVVMAGGFTAGMTDRHARYVDGRARVLHLGVRTTELTARAAREREEEEERLLYVALTRAKAKLVLPLLGGRDGGYAPRGPYRRLNARLREVVDDGAPPELFEVVAAAEVAREGAGVPDAGVAEARALAALATWRPGPALLAPPEPPAGPSDLARARAGAFVTSYSQLKRGLAGGPPATAELDAFRARDAAPDDDDDLPGGTATGLFLHEVLEEAELDAVGASTEEAWTARDDVRALLARAAARHGIDARHAPRAAAIAHAALAAPTWVGPAAPPVAIAAAPRVLREMEFLYAMPGAPHLVKGYLDVVLEHDGRAWVLDWKSDRLARYDALALGQHVAEHYGLQALVYALALARMLRVDDEAAWDARFGGVVFRFLRAVSPGDPRSGVAFQRPRWSEIAAFAASLAGRLAP